MNTLTPEQQSAVDASRTRALTLVTGGPGTGKTHSLRAMIAANRAAGDRVLCLAPTGKAAARITEQTQYPASTIHRGLAWDQRLRRFQHDADTPLPADVVIVDECSMLDVTIAARLFAAIRPSTRLVLVGDKDQLEPVGPGAVFAEALLLPDAAVVTLRQSFRTSTGSPIHEAARMILEGRLPVSSAGFDASGCFFLIARETSEAVADTVLALASARIPNALGAVPQVLTARRQEAVVSASHLNTMLAPVLNPGAPRVGFWPGDQVIQLVNDYVTGVFNGDHGVVDQVLLDGTVVVEFDNADALLSYPTRLQGNLVRSYAVTTHKAQGSEFDGVIVALDEAAGSLLHRKLLYTAVTRAKTVCCVVATKGTAERAIRTLAPSRLTRLTRHVAEMRSAT